VEYKIVQLTGADSRIVVIRDHGNRKWRGEGRQRNRKRAYLEKQNNLPISRSLILITSAKFLSSLKVTYLQLLGIRIFSPLEDHNIYYSYSKFKKDFFFNILTIYGRR
jgi:hypothetical protein